jgi:hypothetical protein
MPVAIQPGECFHIDYGGNIPHFFFVLSAPDHFPGRPLVLAPMTKISPDKNVDDSCLLHPGDHPKCVLESFVDYRRAIYIDTSALMQLVANGQARACPPSVEAPVLQRLREGAESTAMMVDEVRAELWEQGLVTR